MKKIFLIGAVALALQINAQEKNAKVHLNHTAIFVMDIAKAGDAFPPEILCHTGYRINRTYINQ